MVRVLTVLLVLAGVSARASADNPDCARFKVNDPDNYLDTANRIAISHAIGCSKYDFSNEKPQLQSIRYAIDLPGAEESQIVSADFVVRCLDTDARNAFQNYLFCGYDARRLDTKKLDAEIADRKLSPESATNVRAVFKKAQERNAWVLEQLGKYKSENYDYKKIFVDVAEAAANDWQKFYDQHKDVFDLVSSIEKQFEATNLSQRGYQTVEIKGCGDLHNTLKSYLAAQKGKVGPELNQFVQSDQLAFNMMLSAVVCDGMRGYKADAASEYDLLRDARIWRGPRYAAYQGALTSAMAIMAKTNSASPVETGNLWNTHTMLKKGKDVFETNFSLGPDPTTAKIATIKKAVNGWALVTFKLEKWMEPDFDCVDVKPLHFNHWGANGQPVWDWTCKVKGYHPEQRQEKPRSFSETSAVILKPGLLVKMRTGTQVKEPIDQAFPLEVSIPAKTAKDKPKLVGYSGIPLQ